MEHSKYFMWEYQCGFQRNLEDDAAKVFHKLSEKIKPGIILLGFVEEDSGGREPVCIEPEDCGIDAASFAGVVRAAEKAYDGDPGKLIFTSDPVAEAKYQEFLREECRRGEIKKVADRLLSPENRISFVSKPVPAYGCHVFVILHFDAAILDEFHLLNVSEVETELGTKIKRSRCLLEALVKVFLAEAVKPLYKPDPGYDFIRAIETDTKEVLRISGAEFMRSTLFIINRYHTVYDLYETCNFISSLKYEGGAGIGNLLIAGKDHPNIKILIRLKDPAPLGNNQQIRKLLEMTSEDMHLFTDGEDIIGYAVPEGEYDSAREDLYTVNFYDANKWKLIHGGRVLMDVEYGNPGLPKQKVDREKFENNIKRIFPGIGDGEIGRLWNIIIAASGQKHGTIIVISENAKKEAERLRDQSTAVTPFFPDEKTILAISAIDGAVLLDPAGKCYAVGVILDGVASPHGDAARGARYNSAIRYVDMMKKSRQAAVLAVIYSEDGVVDIYPDPRPRIRKSDIEKHLELLRAHVRGDAVDYKVFRPLINWFEKRSFYLGRAECAEINSLRDEYYAKEKLEDGGIRIFHEDFTPHPDMDDSYYLDE